MLIYLLNEGGIFIGQSPLTVEDTLNISILRGLEIKVGEVFE